MKKVRDLLITLKNMRKFFLIGGYLLLKIPSTKSFTSLDVYYQGKQI